MRFENRAVFESLELVLNSIRIELQETGKGRNRLTTPPRPSATPPPAPKELQSGVNVFNSFQNSKFASKHGKYTLSEFLPYTGQHRCLLR